MDRDARWERTARAYEAIVHAVGERGPSGAAAIAAAYERGEDDEFIAPTVIGSYAGMGDGDVVIHLNFRADRARQLTHALADPAFSAFDRGAHPRGLMVVTLTEYQAPDQLPVTVAFGPLVIDSLPALLARLGKRQLHIAETEKYAHVTYFFNGGVEEELPGEDRILIPSNREVPTYDLAPEMRAEPITDAIVAAIESRLVRLHRGELREPRHGRPHRRLGCGGARGRGRGRLSRPARRRCPGRRCAPRDHRRPRKHRGDA